MLNINAVRTKSSLRYGDTEIYYAVIRGINQNNDKISLRGSWFQEETDKNIEIKTRRLYFHDDTVYEKRCKSTI